MEIFRNPSLCRRLAKHLTEWMMENYDSLSDKEIVQLTNEILLYKYIIEFHEQRVKAMLN